jgi:arsenite-transporting ATPase
MYSQADLDEIKHKTRMLLYTGKGGVGKTTIAAATAFRAAELGYRTLVMSTDPAHSLADVLDCPLGPEPQEIRPKLYGQEVNLYYAMQKYWSNVRELILAALQWQGVAKIAAEEVAALPGMEEAAAFLWLEEFYRSEEYDLIVIDSAPTGETLTFLTLPQVGQWWLTKAFPLQKLAAKSLGPVMRAVTGVPLDKGLAELEIFYDRIMAIQKEMSDPDVCSIRLVMNPERMVIQEALRAYTYLQLYGYPVDAAVVNRILPPESASSVFGHYLESQKIYLEQIEQTFAPLPIFHVPHMGREVFGLTLLQEIGTKLYREKDPTEVFYNEKPYQFTPEKGGYLLQIHMPFLEQEEISVEQYDDSLVLQVRNQRRNLFLPKFLAYYKLTESKLEEGWLKVRFVKPAGKA